jgi:molecular chaperone DnaJ
MAASASKRDYNEVLGVARECTAVELKTAYRRLALQYHPDRNPGDKQAEERFKEASEAYEVLSDPEKRARYDRFGHGGSPFEGFGGFNPSNLNDVLGEIFGDIFGATRARRGCRSRGADLRYNLEVSFEEAAFGSEVQVRIQAQALRALRGDGSADKRVRTCPACGGAGELRYTQGFFSVSRPCGTCAGSGQAATTPCTHCRGAGRIDGQTTLTVKIPPGVDSGTRVRVAGEGEPGEHGGPPGDLYVVIHLKDHPIFVREDTEVLCEVPVSFVQAAIGAQIDVPTLDGKHRMKIPAGTQSGKVFRIKGKGIPHLHGGGRGDQHVRILVETPTHLSAEQKELLERFAELSGEQTHPQTKTFFEKVRELFG